MKIIVVSDTHIPSAASSMPKKLIGALKDADLVVHAGDITEMSVISELRKHAEVKAVAGNMDSMYIRANFPQKIIFTAEGVTLGVTHGKGPAGDVAAYVKKVFDKKVDIVIFGHSHSPQNETVNGVLFFNPGSPTDKTFAPYRSYGVITLERGRFKTEIVRIDD